MLQKSLHYSPTLDSLAAVDEKFIHMLSSQENYTPSVNLRFKVLSPFFDKFFVSVPNYIGSFEQPRDETSCTPCPPPAASSCSSFASPLSLPVSLLTAY